MKLEFKKENLQNALNIVEKAVPSKTTSQILECILFDASDKEIKLTANDMELAIETVVEGVIKEKGKVCIDSSIICNIVKKIEDKDDIISIECDKENKITVKCSKATFNIHGKDGEEFSYLPEIDKDKFICISQFTLRESVKDVIFSVNNNDSNKMMGGIFIEVKSDKVRFVTLDGHRISIKNVKMKEKYENSKVIVPSKTLNEISKILSGDNDKDVMIYFSNNHILFEFDKNRIISRLIDGEYFKIDNMISKDYETKISINKNEFINSIDRSMIMIKESEHKPLIFDITKDNINLKVNSSYGKMEEDISCKKSGKDLKIAFNPKFFIDALRVIDDEEVDLYLTNSKSPCFIRDEKENYIYLILPVNFID